MYSLLKTLILAGLLAGGIPTAPAGAGDIDLRDNFDAGPLNTEVWSLRRMNPKRFWFDTISPRQGNGALAIQVKGTDFDAECGCQQNEIRPHSIYRLKFGEEAWYAFSFRVQGMGAGSGSQRWVIGGWKQQTDGSAFLAQRYDRGVFHITIESGDVRLLLASAADPPATFVDVFKTGLLERLGYLTEPGRYQGESDVVMEFGDGAQLPDPGAGWVDMMYRVRGGLDGRGLVEVYANGKFIARATGTIGVLESGGPDQYFKMGHNRVPMPTVATIYFDHFRRGPTRASVEPSTK